MKKILVLLVTLYALVSLLGVAKGRPAGGFDNHDQYDDVGEYQRRPYPIVLWVKDTSAVVPPGFTGTKLPRKIKCVVLPFQSWYYYSIHPSTNMWGMYYVVTVGCIGLAPG